MNDAPTFHLRPATDADREAVNAVWHASASLPSVGLPAMPSRAALRARLDVEWVSGWRVTLAERGNEILGFAALKPAEAMLDQLFVHPDALGQGVGAALLDHAKAAMPEGFTLYTISANTRARAFYEASGLTLLRHAPHPQRFYSITYYGWGNAI